MKVAWRWVALTAAGALAVLGLAAAIGGSAPAASASAVAGTAADPITGTWLLTSRRSDLPSLPQHTIAASSGGFDIVANASYQAGAPQGVTFSVLERASVYNDYPACTVNAGTVVGHFRYTTTDSHGIRHYEGAMLTAQESNACALLGVQGTYYAHLAQWSDAAQSPPLPDGPYNRFCIDSDPGLGCYVTFDRKGGTAAPVTVKSPKKTTVKKPSAKHPVTGLVPRNPKIPPDARFKNDHTPPTVRAVASAGRRGQSFFLYYYANDDRGFAGETYAIFRGAKLLKT